MPLVDTTCAEAMVYESYGSDAKPAFTLFVLNTCRYCPPFRAEVAKLLQQMPNTTVRVVTYEQDPQGVNGAGETAFPALRRKTSKLDKFRGPMSSLGNFLRNS